MHTIEFSNDNEVVRMVIGGADRERLELMIDERRVTIYVKTYLDFGEAFAKAFHSLKGTAALRDVEGRHVMDVTFSHRGVSVRLYDPSPEKTIQTDQSYMTETMRQIGIWNRL
ncbi:MAG: hypothetical protein ACRAUN_05200 [Exiguobacterium profundum]